MKTVFPHDSIRNGTFATLRAKCNKYASNSECSSGNHLSISHFLLGICLIFPRKLVSYFPCAGLYQWDSTNDAEESKIIWIHEVPRSIESIERSIRGQWKNRNSNRIIPRKREANFRKKVCCMHQLAVHISDYYLYSLTRAESRSIVLLPVSDAVCNRVYSCLIIFFETREPKFDPNK